MSGGTLHGVDRLLVVVLGVFVVFFILLFLLIHCFLWIPIISAAVMGR